MEDLGATARVVGAILMRPESAFYGWSKITKPFGPYNG